MLAKKAPEIELFIVGLDSKNCSDRKKYILLGYVGNIVCFTLFGPMNIKQKAIVYKSNCLYLLLKSG
jgi:hypothetical protein